MAGVISYSVNRYQIKNAVIQQLQLSTQKRLHKESLPFKEVKKIHQNYLNEFQSIYEQPDRRKELAENFDRYFYIRSKDKSYQERPEIFSGALRIEGQDLSDTSASFPPNVLLNDDIKSRFALTFLLTHKYGKVTENHFFDLFASIPEGGWTNHWAGHHDSEEEDYSSPAHPKIDELEWFQRSYNTKRSGSSYTNMYLDDTMHIWMVSLLSYGETIPGKKQLYSVGTDFSLEQLIARTAKPSIPGTKAVIFCNNEQGTLIYHPNQLSEIKNTKGKISIKDLNDENLLPILQLLNSDLNQNSVNTIETDDYLIAFGIIDETDWCMAIQYPKAFITPAIIDNLIIVVSVGLLTLLIELFIFQSILQNQVAKPLSKLLRATRLLGTSSSPLDTAPLPIDMPNEIGDLARNFSAMAERIQNTRGQLESTVTARTLELEKAKNEADAANAAKSMFLANMSHEIRTPMHGILGMSNSLKRAGLTPQQAEKLNKMDTSAHHLLNIINSILDLSKIEAGKLTLEEIPVDITSIFTNISFILSENANSKGIDLITETQEWPNNLYGDPTRIQQALLNYSTNAIKFTEKGAVTLRALKQEETTDSLLVKFEVHDNGIGISADTLPRLFKAFEQADNSTTRKYGGTGLGLAITQKLAELMGGKVGVESSPTVGSTFWFTVRFKKKEPVERIVSTKLDANAETFIKKRYSGFRILVVDDEPLNRELVQTFLQDAGLVISTAGDGLEAIAMAKKTAYSIIILDMQMPNMGGLEATKLIRELPGYQKTPIIALTANAFIEDKNKCFDAGMDDIIIKPFDVDVLFTTILKWLSN